MSQQPCQRTQDKLDQLLKEANYDSIPAFKTYFLMKPHTLPTGEVVSLVRCLKCGCAVDEHRSVEEVAAGHDRHPAEPKQSVHQSPSPSSAQAMSALYRHVAIANPLSSVPDVRLADHLCSPVSDPPTSGTEADVQSWLVAVAKNVNPETALHLLEASSSPPEALRVPLQHLKPDGVIYVRGGKGMDGCALAAIELKKPDKKLAGDDATLQLFNYLHAILYQQPTRLFCFGLLLNGVDAVFYRAVREKAATKYFMQFSGSFAEGKAFLAWLLTATLVDLGYNPPIVTLGGLKYSLTTFIGSGQHCAGYEVRCGDAVIVVKHYTDKKKAKNERTVCRLLSGVKSTAQLYDPQPLEEEYVAITPRGYLFDSEHPIRKDHVECLCSALVALHERGLVHRDICRFNIYWLDERNALLNDWSHCAKVSNSNIERAKDFDRLMRAIEEVGGDLELRYPLYELFTTARRASEEPLKKKSRK